MMYEVLNSPITLLCLSIMFLLCALLFLYFKRTIAVLENAQMQQAQVLQSFITQFEATRMRETMHTNAGMPSNTRGPNVNNETEKLIDVSDDDESDSEEESDDSDDESIQEINLNNENVEINDLSDDIKVIQLNSNDNLENATLEEININDSTVLESVNSDDTSDDSDDEEDSNDIEEVQINYIPEDKKSSIDDIDETVVPIELPNEIQELKSEIIDFKTLNVTTLRQMAESNNLINKGEKKNKKDLVKLLEENN